MVTTVAARMHSQDLAAVLEARGFAYRLLMQVFLAEPSGELIQSLAGSGAVRLFPRAADSALIRQGVAEADRFLSSLAGAGDAVLDDLRWDFTRMFIGPDRLPAPPWESAYRTEDRLLFQAETLEVRRAYLKYGFLPRNHGSEPDDHMGLELSFLYETCRLAMEAARAGQMSALGATLEDQLDFLNAHLLQWGPAFAADVAKSARTGYYRGMAHILAAWMPTDRSILQELLQDAPET